MTTYTPTPSQESHFEAWATKEQMSLERGVHRRYVNTNTQWAWDGFVVACQPAWISVKDRLPEKHVEVMVWPNPTEYSMTANFYGDVWKYAEYEHHFGVVHHICKVSHWMTIPAAPSAPPKEGEK